MKRQVRRCACLFCFRRTKSVLVKLREKHSIYFNDFHVTKIAIFTIFKNFD